MPVEYFNPFRNVQIDPSINVEELAKQNRELAEKRVRGDFLLKKIAELEEIKLADEDLERGYERIASQYRMSVPEVKQYFQRREEILPFVAELLNEKILRFLLDAAVITEAAETEEETTTEAQSA